MQLTELINAAHLQPTAWDQDVSNTAQTWCRELTDLKKVIQTHTTIQKANRKDKTLGLDNENSNINHFLPCPS